MKFKSVAIPEPSEGIKITEPSQVVPDQSLTLEDILERFTRGEALPVGQEGQYGSDGDIDPESEDFANVDLEKAKHWDLTEKDDFKTLVNERKEQFEAEQKKAAEKEAAEKAEKEKKDFEEKVEKEVEKRGKKKPSE